MAISVVHLRSINVYGEQHSAEPAEKKRAVNLKAMLEAQPFECRTSGNRFHAIRAALLAQNRTDVAKAKSLDGARTTSKSSSSVPPQPAKPTRRETAKVHNSNCALLKFSYQLRVQTFQTECQKHQSSSAKHFKAKAKQQRSFSGSLSTTQKNYSAAFNAHQTVLLTSSFAFNEILFGIQCRSKSEHS